MAKKTKKVETEHLTVDNNETIDVPVENQIESSDSYTLKKHSIRELLELTEVALILGKKYENLAIAEGTHYFVDKQKYNDFYNKIIAELEHRVNKYYL